MGADSLPDWRTETSTVPTVAERNGDFSALLITGQSAGNESLRRHDDVSGPDLRSGHTEDVGGIPCRTAFPNNTIPAARFNTVAKNLLPYYPLPTNSAVQQLLPASVSPINNTTETIRIDYNASEKNKFYGSYSSRENNLATGGFAQLPYPVSPNTWKQDF